MKKNQVGTSQFDDQGDEDDIFEQLSNFGWFRRIRF